MKRTLASLLLLLVAATTVFADADYKARKNCFGIFSWRYKAYAKCDKSWNAPDRLADGSGTSTACSGNLVQDKKGWYHPSGSGVWTMWAQAHGQAGPGIDDWSNTWIYPSETGNFSVGFSNPFAMPATETPMYSDENADYSAMEGVRSDIGTTEILFDDANHAVILQGLKARLGVDAPDMVNSFATFKIWVLDATGVENEDETKAKVIQTFQAFVYNGRLVIEGELGSLTIADFRKEGVKSFWSLASQDIRLNIPAGISLDNIVIRVGSDCGNLGNGVSEDYKPNLQSGSYARQAAQSSTSANSRDLSFSINQNPVTNTLVAVVEPGIQAFATAEITLLGFDGNRIAMLFVGAKEELSSRKITYDMSGLPAGAYFLVLRTDKGEKFTKKIVKQ